MFGLVALVSICVYALAGVGSLSLTVVSVFRSRTIRLYWILTLMAVGVGLFTGCQIAVPQNQGGEYGAFAKFILGAFSYASLFAIVGSIRTVSLAFAKHEAIRSFSGLTAGVAVFYATYLVRLFL